MQHLYIDNRDGFGERDFTNYLLDASRFFSHTKNEPQLFDFAIANTNDGGDWVVPQRGAFVRFVDDRWERRHSDISDGVLYTGYVTEEPDPKFLGVNEQSVWAYEINTMSEEFLANSKRLPPVTYVNKTRGFILRDLLEKLFVDSPTSPYNLTGIMEGGVEQLFQVDTSQSWSELAEAFAEADGYSYWVLDSFVYYGPEAPVTTSNDPLYYLAIDESDPRFKPTNLALRRVARDIVNDVTVLGLDEPTDIVREHFVSDGYQGFHNLAFAPYGIEENIIITDDFTGEIEDDTWEEVDSVSDYIQAFEGALNVVGGTGVMGQTYLRGRKPIELNGIIELRDGEVYFPPSPTGVTYVGALFEDETVDLASMWSGWQVDGSNSRITPVSLGVVQSAYSYTINPTRHYILRRTIQVDRQVGFAQGFTQASTLTTYRFDTAYSPNTVITWVIEEINNDDVNNVFSTITTVASLHLATMPPAYVLYSPVASVNGHLVMNYVIVSKPQQAVLTVNGRQCKLGSYLDGGRATLENINGKGRLSWYSINEGGSGSIVSYLNSVLGDAPTGYWRMDVISAGTFADVSGYQHHAGATNVVAGQGGALNGDDNQSSSFNGSSSYCSGSAFETASKCSFEAWFKTTSSGNMTIWSNRTVAGLGDFVSIVNGFVFYGCHDLGGFTSTRSGLNDGRWHHVVWTTDSAQTPDNVLYIDGVADMSFNGVKSAKNNPFYIGRDLFAEAALPGDGYFNGQLDEIAVYSNVCLTSAQVANHYKRGMSSAFSDVVTVPPAGSAIALSYYRKQASRARLRSAESIAIEKARYGDDGVRQKVVRADSLSPAPRTSEECLALAQAILTDAAFLRYEGTYGFECAKNTPTELRYWPKPGDRVMCLLDLPDGESMEQELSIQTVESDMIGKEAYSIRLGFGPINRFDVVIRDLIMKRKTSLNDPVIRTEDADELATINEAFPYPSDLLDCTVTSITADTFYIALAGSGIPSDVVNYEVREDDTGWGQTNADSGYVTRFRATSFSFARTKRDLRYYIRPYNTSGQYSKRSAFIRVACPSANTYTMTGVTGTISASTVRVVVPIPRDPDYAGIRIQHYNAGGTILYQGNGEFHEVLGTGVSTVLEAGFITVSIPNRGYYDTPGPLPGFSAWVNTYNLLNLFGTGMNKIISEPAAGALTQQPFNAGDFTANGSMSWTVEIADVINLSYALDGQKMDVLFDIRNTSVGGTLNNTLRMTIPNGKTAAKDTTTVIAIWDNGTRTGGLASVTAGGTIISIERLDGANFAAATNNTQVKGQMVLQIA